MKCRRIEKLIPLYVEGDLASGIAARIASHLELCGKCNWLADEYKESQSWLCSSDQPVFDEAELRSLKAGVLRQIAETGAKPSRFANLIQHWSRRQVLALSAAMLIVFGAVVFYIYQAGLRAKPLVDESATVTPENNGSTPQQATTDQATADKSPRAVVSKTRGSTARPAGKRRHASPETLEQELQPLVSQANPPEQSGTGSMRAGGSDDLPEMLRIDIQTGDPNIRIIWFAPKEVESPKTNQ